MGLFMWWWMSNPVSLGRWAGLLYALAPVSYTHLMLRQWIAEKRYRELISCAHGGWYTDDVIFEPLAEHFAENHLFDELRFLCERGIRFSIEDMLFCIKTEKEEHSTLDVKTVQKINVNDYIAGQDYWQLGEIAKYRTRALRCV